MTPTDIANLSLGKLGASLITDLDEEPTLRLHYDQALATQLRRHPWTFATKGPQDLAQVDPQPTPTPAHFSYLFALPGDYLKRQTIESEGLQIADSAYRMIGRNIWTIYTLLTLTYTRNDPDPAHFDPLFVEALTTLLASKIAREILGSPRDASDQRNQWDATDLPAAIAEDVHDNPGQLKPFGLADAYTSPLIQSRTNWHPKRLTTPSP